MPDGSVNIYLYSDIENVAPENINTVYIKKNTIQYVYDANGNMTQRIVASEITDYTYDAEDRLIRVDLPDGNYEEYQYNGFGQRTKVFYNGNLSKKFVYYNQLETCSIEDSIGNIIYLTRGLDIIGGIGGIIASYNSNTSNTVYHLYNHRGDIIENINESEDILYSTTYDAFGTNKHIIGENLIDNNYSTKQYNATTGLSYFGSRYYMKESGRWITRDPIRFDGGLNIYGFNNNNPVNFIDPDGEAIFTLPLQLVGAIVVVSGIVIGAVKLTEKINNDIPAANAATARMCNIFKQHRKIDRYLIHRPVIHIKPRLKLVHPTLELPVAYLYHLQILILLLKEEKQLAQHFQVMMTVIRNNRRRKGC